MIAARNPLAGIDELEREMKTAARSTFVLVPPVELDFVFLAVEVTRDCTKYFQKLAHAAALRKAATAWAISASVASRRDLDALIKSDRGSLTYRSTAHRRTVWLDVCGGEKVSSDQDCEVIISGEQAGYVRITLAEAVRKGLPLRRGKRPANSPVPPSEAKIVDALQDARDENSQIDRESRVFAKKHPDKARRFEKEDKVRQRKYRAACNARARGQALDVTREREQLTGANA